MLCVIGKHVAVPDADDATAPLIVGVKATSKTRRAFRAALTPPAARTTTLVAAPKIMAVMAHQKS